MKNNLNLFLDDIRMPSNAYVERLWNNPHEIYINKSWEVVENYLDFVKWILENGVPDIISFDHDLAPSHYTPSHLWNDYEKSKKWQDEQIHEEKTGYECALWLVKYCKTNNLQLPIIYSHSANPVGKDKILKVFKLC